MHEMRRQALRSELEACKRNAATMEFEATEMRDQLKKLSKKEKNEKGMHAMTEELKKLEAETGMNVSQENITIPYDRFAFHV